MARSGKNKQGGPPVQSNLTTCSIMTNTCAGNNEESSAQSSKGKMPDSIQDTKATNPTNDDEHKSLQEQIEEIKGQAQKKDADFQEMKDKMSLHDEDLARLDAKVQVLEKENDSLRRLNNTLMQRLKEMKEKHEEELEELAKSNKSAELTQKMKKSTQELVQANKRTKDLEKKLEDTDIDLAFTKVQLGFAQNDLQAAIKERKEIIDSQSANYKSWNEKWEALYADRENALREVQEHNDELIEALGKEAAAEQALAAARSPADEESSDKSLEEELAETAEMEEEEEERKEAGVEASTQTDFEGAGPLLKKENGADAQVQTDFRGHNMAVQTERRGQEVAVQTEMERGVEASTQTEIEEPGVKTVRFGAAALKTAVDSGLVLLFAGMTMGVVRFLGSSEPLEIGYGTKWSEYGATY